MSERAERLSTSWKSRTAETLRKARSEINQLIASEDEVTFAAVHKTSGVSKNFLYNNAEIRKEIENARKDTHELAEIKRQKRLKTKQSRDVVLEAKDRRIKKPEEENRRLKQELDTLRGRLYDGIL